MLGGLLGSRNLEGVSGSRSMDMLDGVDGILMGIDLVARCLYTVSLDPDTARPSVKAGGEICD